MQTHQYGTTDVTCTLTLSQRGTGHLSFLRRAEADLDGDINIPS